MTNSWYDTSVREIERVHASLPKDISFKDRRKAVQDAYPFGERRYYPYKAWCRAQREYLAKYDPRPSGPLHAAMMESPQDKAKRKSAEYDAMLQLSRGFVR